MNNERQPCTREGLHCWVSVSDRYTVDDDGNPVGFLESTAEDMMSSRVEYGCWNCHNYWGCEYNDESRMKAWQAVIAHINVTHEQEPAA